MSEAHSRKLTLSFSEQIAFNLEHEAQLENISITELVRRGVSLAIINSTARRDIEAHFPEGSNLNYSFVIIAESTDGNVKEFELNPSLDNMAGPHITLSDEYQRGEEI
jgi:hypothetical protein